LTLFLCDVVSKPEPGSSVAPGIVAWREKKQTGQPLAIKGRAALVAGRGLSGTGPALRKLSKSGPFFTILGQTEANHPGSTGCDQVDNTAGG